jgi:hypothetical protein
VFIAAGSGGLNRPLGLTFAPLTTTSSTDSAYQVRYATNFSAGESYIDIGNTGANGAALYGPGYGVQFGNICVNVYALDPGEELVSCCSCLITPDQTVHLGVNADLLSNTANGTRPTSVMVKLVATLAGTATTGTNCTQSAATAGGTAFPMANAGMVAFGTTLHQGPTLFDTTGTPFTAATLSAAELASLTGRCAAILGDLSGAGICNSCHSGALGATKK